MSCAVDNNAFEIIITPTRKRKRDPVRDNNSQLTALKPSAFTNAAFSSTPKKQITGLIKECKHFPPNNGTASVKDNLNKFPSVSGLEVKSISELVNERRNTDTGNPFEVVRKPPKKKLKPNAQEACFINPGLNLELPEQQFNPFEVKRDTVATVEESQCFVNSGLNIRTQDTTAARNPFEIQRSDPTTENNNAVNGIENFGLDLAGAPLRIGLPFKPNVGYRIDFNNLTPSKLLAEKLVFSPINKTPRVLSDISEEETTMDIGRELDRYQLELENSINEAKQKKKPAECVTFADRLENIAENPQENEMKADEPKTPEVISKKQFIETKTKEDVLQLDEVDTPPVQKTAAQVMESTMVSTASVHIEKKLYVKDHKRNESYTDDEGIDYDDDEEDEEIDFKTPAPFVRAYRKPDPPPNRSHQSTELPMRDMQPPPVVLAENKSKVKDIIRKSIRRLIHSDKVPNDEKINKKPVASSESESTGHHIMEAIRHSLRRRPQKPTVEVEIPNTREISIIDASERKIKLKSNLIQTDYIKIEELTAERKSSLRSSIKKSTRDVKNQIMKSVFHMNKEEYAFAQ